MSSEEIVFDEEGTENRTELEKLLLQKQQETEALKRLIDILGKPDRPESEPPRKTEQNKNQLSTDNQTSI
ncbi:MAG TPA: hypothetical protein PKG48_00520 [Bacteroidales bacterium]|nr:hypothetical protein [Bacteroidales bacterium]HPS61422.1 hypothetical protein [Bacteroidales bacterium]